MTESLSSFWDAWFGEWGDLGAVFPPCPPTLLTGVVSNGSLGPCSLPWTLLIGVGVPVECPGVSMNSWGAQTVVLLATVYFGLPRLVLLLVLIHLF